MDRPPLPLELASWLERSLQLTRATSSSAVCAVYLWLLAIMQCKRLTGYIDLRMRQGKLDPDTGKSAFNMGGAKK